MGEEGPGAAAAQRGVITLGFGAEHYRNMAVALARSVRRLNPELPLAVVTDAVDDPRLRDAFDVLLPFDPSRGEGVHQKLSLDLYSPFDETLFIDSDCLAVRPLDRVFDLMGIVPVGVVGFPVVDGFYWADVEELRRRYKVPYVGRFNAGLILIRGTEGRAVLATAREIVADDGLEGLPLYHGALHDEIPIAIALARHGILPVYDDGTIMRTPEPLESRLQVDVHKGQGRFRTNGQWVEPALVHFAYLYHGDGVRGSIYRREVRRLEGRKGTIRNTVECAAAQAMFTFESIGAVRRAWKAVRPRFRAKRR